MDKNVESVAAEGASLAERTNVVYPGTAVAYGRGLALVASTGTGTDFGKVTRLLYGIETLPRPLQRNLEHVARRLAATAPLAVLLVVAGGLFRGAPLLEVFLFRVALAVAVVPDALPAVVTISLALGIQRMA